MEKFFRRSAAAAFAAPIALLRQAWPDSCDFQWTWLSAAVAGFGGQINLQRWMGISDHPSASPDSSRKTLAAPEDSLGLELYNRLRWFPILPGERIFAIRLRISERDPNDMGLQVSRCIYTET
jgi:hypothetical protein